MPNIRDQFIKFFTSHMHCELKFPSILPKQDPTLLFINSGMAAMKSYFIGGAQPPAKQIVTVQPCLRVGGKHNDLEMVGKTTRHHTFFEMLGNFSFGEYMHERAIGLAWQFITQELQLNPADLWVTVHPKDIASRECWKNIGIDPARILDVAENSWAAGDVGPRGYCTEIFYDFGPNHNGARPDLGDTGERYIEIWNIVFMDECVNKDGMIEKLAIPCVDTGMGLERIEAVMSGSHDSYNSVIMKELLKIAGTDVSARVLADHARAIVFLVADGIQPGPCGRNYILRRLLRRALRHQILLQKEGLLEALALKTISLMQHNYPHLRAAQELVSDVINTELGKFMSGWKVGSAILEAEIAKLHDQKILSGDVAFTLYDTYGLPLDLTASICQERNIEVDYVGFDAAMNIQRDRSSTISNNKVVFENIENISDTIFVGYANNSYESQIESLFNLDGAYTTNITNGGWIILHSTPFYAEAGGQASDRGFINDIQVSDVKKIGEIWFHKVDQGAFSVGQKVKCIIDEGRRALLRVHHSATHILYAALRKCCAKFAVCSSAVDVDKFRLDFTYSAPIDKELISKIERVANDWIRADLKFKAEYMSFKDARDIGAEVLPGAQYPEFVRVISVGDNIDIQLCCGTHVSRSSEIGGIRIIEAKSVGANVKRIVAKAGIPLIEHLEQYKFEVEKIAAELGTSPADIRRKINVLKDQPAVNNNQEFTYYRNDNLLLAHINITQSDKDKALTSSKLIELATQVSRKHNADIVFSSVINADTGTVVCMLGDRAITEHDARVIGKNCSDACGGGAGGGKINCAQYSIKNPQDLKRWIAEFAGSLGLVKVELN